MLTKLWLIVNAQVPRWQYSLIVICFHVNFIWHVFDKNRIGFFNNNDVQSAKKITKPDHLLLLFCFPSFLVFRAHLWLNATSRN